MTWTILIGLVLVLGISLFAALARRAELARMQGAVEAHDEVQRLGGATAQLQHPVVDLSRCLGCGTCVDVCPEEGVLEMVHGQAKVVRGARCMGIAACERECPVDAITVTLADTADREDIPNVDSELEALGRPGLFLAGEVTAHALIKTAIEHGTRVANTVAARLARLPPAAAGELDLVIVGAGPAGLACALEATRQGLSFVVLEKADAVGGTVSTYPRRKLVLTEPVHMPMVGALKSRSYTKEELVETWDRWAVEFDLPIEYGQRLRDVEDRAGGGFVVTTDRQVFHASHVCMAIGRRGVPRKLGVPGEELPKVAHGLLDAGSYHGRDVLVVGGGDSAVEVALGLAEQGDNRVTIAYRKSNFFRLKARNEQRLQEARAAGALTVHFDCKVTAIDERAVSLSQVEARVAAGAEATGGRPTTFTLPNDDVFVMIGGEPPTELLATAGVSFDPSLREAPEAPAEQGTGLVNAIAAGFAMTLLALAFALWHHDYYMLPAELQPTHDKHALLRSGQGLGLWLGIGATLLVLVNLAYVLRRSPKIPFRLGSLQGWMTSHIATGVLALLFTLLHAAMRPEESPGGHALWALVILTVTGAIGRYFYAWLPRAANGRELDLAEVRAQLENVPEEAPGKHRSFRKSARAKVVDLIEARQWRGSFFGRVAALSGVRRDLRHVLGEIRADGRARGLEDGVVEETLQLARAAHRNALVISHYEDMRAVLGTWRYLHRWVAALMVLLMVVHIIHALSYGDYFGGAK